MVFMDAKLAREDEKRKNGTIERVGRRVGSETRAMVDEGV
jgi:hypothetical protein